MYNPPHFQEIRPMRRLLAATLLVLAAACDTKPPPPPPGPSGGDPAAAAGQIVFPKGEAAYHFGADDAKTTIRFESKTSVTNILGKTTKARGGATIDFDKNSGKAHLQIPVLSLRSGMDDRDRAMIGKSWLDVDGFPLIEYKADQATRLKPSVWKLDGKFTLHGVSKDLSVEAEVKPVPSELSELLGPGQWIRVKTEFKVKFTDFGIAMDPKYHGVIEEVWSIAVQLFGTTEKLNVSFEGLEDPRQADPEPVKSIKAVDATGIEGVKYRFGTRTQLATLTATSETDLENVIAQTSGVNGLLGLDAARGTGKVRLRMPVDRLRTGNKLQEEHLRGEDWLNSKKNPEILFESTKATRKDDKRWALEGDFTMNAITKPVALDVETWEISKDLVVQSKWGKTAGLGFRGEFKVRLSDFGVKIPAIAKGKVNDVWTIQFMLIGLQEGE
jgi:polyisoprenoid-binding protein YceI